MCLPLGHVLVHCSQLTCHRVSKKHPMYDPSCNMKKTERKQFLQEIQEFARVQTLEFIVNTLCVYAFKHKPFLQNQQEHQTALMKEDCLDHLQTLNTNVPKAAALPLNVITLFHVYIFDHTKPCNCSGRQDNQSKPCTCYPQHTVGKISQLLLSTLLPSH